MAVSVRRVPAMNKDTLDHSIFSETEAGTYIVKKD
jgi:hypothetical protein